MAPKAAKVNGSLPPEPELSPILAAALAGEDLPVEPAAQPSVDYVCGLRKTGPSRYALVSGRVVNGVAELKVDPISQTLDLAAEELREQFRRLMTNIP